MDNEIYQKNLEKNSHIKRNVTGHQYFGDKNAKLLFILTKKIIQEPILDIEAGTGALVQCLWQNGYLKAQGIDLYPKADFINQGVITNLQFESGTLQTIFCIEVLEHLTDKQIQQGLQEIKRVMNKEGHLIITVPYGEVLDENIFVCPECGHHFHKVGHLQSFDKQRIKDVLTQNGFSVISMKVYPLGAMSKLPLGKYMRRLFLKLPYEFIGKTLITICRK
jgi:predicted SAM-dependent methyltransferase